MARITGLGGVFFHSPDPQALAAWYKDVLGLDVQDWGGAIIKGENKGEAKGENKGEGAGPAYQVWSPFATTSDHFKPSTREFMLNFSVDDLDAFAAALEAKGVSVQGRQEMEGMGKFAFLVDPDGTKIELWQPA